MPTVRANGVPTEFEVVGSGPTLLCFSPGGFNAVRQNWWELGVYRHLGLIDRLASTFQCIVFDRREAGGSGGAVERLDWPDLVAQGIGLLDELGIDRAHLMGGCVGCSIAARTAVDRPERVAGLVLYSPAGGPRYRMGQHRRFQRHLAFVAEHGLQAVVDLARRSTEGFSQEPRIGPWGALLRRDEEFASAYAAIDASWYEAVVVGTARVMFDRDTVPGVEPEDLLAITDLPILIVPGNDASHAPSAAHFLQECLPKAEFWQGEPGDDRATERVAAFLASAQAQRPAA